MEILEFRRLARLVVDTSRMRTDSAMRMLGLRMSGFRAWRLLWRFASTTPTPQLLATSGYGTYKILGVGTVSFVQNHPYDPSSVIVYAAPEGDEVCHLHAGDGQARRRRGDGTAGRDLQVGHQPRSWADRLPYSGVNWCDLYVVEKATDEITVRSRDGVQRTVLSTSLCTACGSASKS